VAIQGQPGEAPEAAPAGAAAAAGAMSPPVVRQAAPRLPMPAARSPLGGLAPLCL
jgi:hypothetical protein